MNPSILAISTRLRNIEETEKAKLTLSQGRTRDHKAPDDEAHLAATRCESFSFALYTLTLVNYVVHFSYSLPPSGARQVRRRYHPRCQARSTRTPASTRGGRSSAGTSDGDGRAGDGAIQEAHAQVSSMGVCAPILQVLCCRSRVRFCRHVTQLLYCGRLFSR